jgi:hypothetical protein
VKRANFKAGILQPLLVVPRAEQFEIGNEGRFLIQVPVEQTATNVPITVITNWQADLKQKLPASVVSRPYVQSRSFPVADPSYF